jgi:hypothetical protein
MDGSVNQLLRKLTPDEWRLETGFSSEMREFNTRLLDSTKSDAELAEIAKEWLRKFQPCIFGRIAAGKLDIIGFCILKESDLQRDDDWISQKIQRYRRHWKKQGYRGLKSAFVIMAISPKIVWANPNKTLMTLATRICELYLEEEEGDIKPDEIYHDRLTLAASEPERSEEVEYFEWRVGINYFSPQGDRRWWHDHRIPGGIAFSMNSVGHMAKSGARTDVILELEKAAAVPLAHRGKLKIDSLGAALQYAMMTIDNAQESVSGKATWLTDLTGDERKNLAKENPLSMLPSVPRNIDGKDFRKYKGRYHTDVTLPSSYFRRDVELPPDIKALDLYFSYLFDKAEISYRTMGEGVPR